jgi:hypothetical protein
MTTVSSSFWGRDLSTEVEVPETENIRVEGISVRVRYEKFGLYSVRATLEVDIADAMRLPWYPELSDPKYPYVSYVSVREDDKEVLLHYVSRYTYDVAELRTKIVHWQAEVRRQADVAQLRPRLNAFDDEILKVRRLDWPVQRLEALHSEARLQFSRFDSGYKALTLGQVEKCFERVDEELKRLHEGDAQVIVDDLIDGVLYHPDLAANQAIIDEVREWHICTNGFIDLIDESVLRAFYERRITSKNMGDFVSHSIRLKLEDYVLPELLEELDDIAPAKLVLEKQKGSSSYELKYDFLEREGKRVSVASVTLPLRVYEHNAPEYGKKSGFPKLPHQIELYVEVLFDGGIIAAGTPGEDLDRKIAKFKKSRSRSNPLKDVADEFGLRRYRPIEKTQVPPWFKGRPPRY